MSNPLFNILGGMQRMQNAQNGLGGIMNAIQQLKANPANALKQAGFTVPDNIGNNPQAIINHLMQSGQISQDKLAQAQQMAAQFKR